MKNNNNIEKERIKALRYFLGFPGKLKSKESLSYLEKLNMMKDSSRKFILSKEDQEIIWKKIQQRLGQNRDFSKLAASGRLNNAIRRFFVNRYFISVFSLSFLAISTFVYFQFFHFINEPSADAIILTMKTISTQPAIAAQRLNLSKTAFSTKTNRMLAAKIGNSLNLYFRGIYNLTGKKAANKISLNFAKGMVLFNYKNRRGRLTLEIQTAKTTVKITGTEFILARSNDKTSVLIREGKVLVTYNKQKLLIGKHCLWQSPKAESVTMPADRVDKIFARFKNSNYPFTSFDELIKPRDTKKQLKFIDLRKNKKIPKLKTKIEIFLKNGDALSGRVLFENEKKIILETTLGDVIEIGKSEIQTIK